MVKKIFTFSILVGLGFATDSLADTFVLDGNYFLNQ